MRYAMGLSILARPFAPKADSAVSYAGRACANGSYRKVCHPFLLLFARRLLPLSGHLRRRWKVETR